MRKERKKAVLLPKDFKKHFAMLIALASICPHIILEFTAVKKYVRITFINSSLSPSLFLLLPYALHFIKAFTRIELGTKI